MEDQLESDFGRKVSMAESEEDDCELLEREWEIEGQTLERNEPTENVDHQVFETIPKRVHQFYFVKWWPYENPNADAKIKRDEEIIEKMNKSHLHITQQIEDGKGNKDLLSWQYQRLEYKEEQLRTEVRWRGEKLGSQQKVLDRLSFANNAYSDKGFKSCLSNGEVDKQKLQFQMLHGCRSMSDEKILREISTSQKKADGIAVSEFNERISIGKQKLCGYSYPCYYQPKTKSLDYQADHRKCNLRVQAIEKDIANAVVNGNLWNSWGPKKDIQNQLKYVGSELLETYKKQRLVRGKIKPLKKRMEDFDKKIASLQNQQIEIALRKDEAYESILSLKKLYGEENASFYQYRSLLKKAITLAEKKDIAGLEELSHKEVEDFMSVWNSDKDFRDDYRKRSVQSLNARKLGRDGRRMKETDEVEFEEESSRIVKPEALSKTRLKWLMKDHHISLRF